MKKKVCYAVLWLFFALLSLNQIQAQSQSTTRGASNLSKFITVGLTDFGLGSTYSNYGGFVGYEQYLNSRLSVLGELNYERRVYNGIWESANYRRVGIAVGLRYRVVRMNRLSLYTETLGGYAFEKYGEGAINGLFAEAGLGAEYVFSDRIKATAGLSGRYSQFDGIRPKLKLSAQFRLGK